MTISFRYPIHAQRATGDAQRSVLEQALGNTLGYACLLETITFDEEGGTWERGRTRNRGQARSQRKAKEKPPPRTKRHEAEP